MHIAVIGANGRTGRLVVERALGHGHEVTALVHSSSDALPAARVAVVQGDAGDVETVRKAVTDADGVVVAVGGGERGLHERVIASVVHAMALSGVSRLAVLSAAGTFAQSDPNLSVALRLMRSVALRAVYEDLEAMERRVMASDLDWAIVRPYGLTDGAATGNYRVSLDGALLPKASRISRGDVAAVLLKSVETSTYLRRAIVVGD